MVHGFLLCTAWLDAARAGVAELAAVLRAGLDPAAGGTWPGRAAERGDGGRRLRGG